MGQNVNYLLGNQATMLGADPELYRQQLIQREQTRINALPPQQAYAAQMGSILGRGLGNIGQNRGFFEVTDPVLQKLTAIQNVYDQATKAADPNDPLSFYKELQTRFTDAGFGQQAMMANQELRKFEAEDLKTKALETEVYTKNPALLDERIAKARDAGNNPLANRLAEQRGQIQIDIDKKRQLADLDLLVKQSNIKVNEAQIEKIKADVEAGKVQIVSSPADLVSGTPAQIRVFRNGKLEDTISASPALTNTTTAKPGMPAPAYTWSPGKGFTPVNK
jgi:hypothetical protein